MLSNLVIHKTICYTAIILLQNKALGKRNPLIKKSGFPKMHHNAGFFANQVTYLTYKTQNIPFITFISQLLPCVLSWIQSIIDCGFEIMEA